MLADPRLAAAFPDALEMVGAVHDGGPDAVQAVYSRADVPALVVALAALVDPDRTPTELLSWATPTPRAKRVQRPRPPQPRAEPVCGLPNWHASYTRHKAHGETPCEDCVLGERDYQRNRPGKRRGDRVGAAA